VLLLGFRELKQCGHEFLTHIVIHYSSIHFVRLSFVKPLLEHLYNLYVRTGIVSSLRADRPSSRGSMSSKGTGFSLLQTAQFGSGTHPAFCQMVNGSFSSRR